MRSRHQEKVVKRKTAQQLERKNMQWRGEIAKQRRVDNENQSCDFRDEKSKNPGATEEAGDEAMKRGRQENDEVQHPRVPTGC